MEDLDGMVDVTVTAELNNGKVYVLKQACCKAALENNTREGQFRVRWEGTTCEEITTTAGIGGIVAAPGTT